MGALESGLELWRERAAAPTRRARGAREWSGLRRAAGDGRSQRGAARGGDAVRRRIPLECCCCRCQTRPHRCATGGGRERSTLSWSVRSGHRESRVRGQGVSRRGRGSRCVRRDHPSFPQFVDRPTSHTGCRPSRSMRSSRYPAPTPDTIAVTCGSSATAPHESSGQRTYANRPLFPLQVFVPPPSTTTTARARPRLICTRYTPAADSSIHLSRTQMNSS